MSTMHKTSLLWIIALACLASAGHLRAEDAENSAETTSEAASGSYLDRIFPQASQSPPANAQTAEADADQARRDDAIGQTYFLADYPTTETLAQGQGGTFPGLPQLPPVGQRPTGPGRTGDVGGQLPEMTGIKFENIPLNQVIEQFNEWLGTNYILEIAKDGLDPNTEVSYEYQAYRELTRKDLEEIFEDFLREMETDPDAEVGFRLAVERRGGRRFLRQAFSFGSEGLPLPQFIFNIAEILEINYILDPKAGSNQKVTLVTHKNVFLTKNQLWDVFYTVLQLNGLALFEKGTYYQIVPIQDLTTKPVDIDYPEDMIYDMNLVEAFSDINQRSESNRVVVEVFPVKYMSPPDVINYVKPFMSPTSNITNPPGSNLLIVTETQANIKKILKLIEIVDVDSTLGGLEVFQIVYADATELSSVIQKILNSKARALVQPGGGAPAQPQRRRGRGRSRARPVTTGGSSSGQSNMLIHADKRSNSLVMFGERRDIEFARQIIQILDRDIYSSSRTFMYYVEYAKADELAQLLNSVYRRSGSSSSGSNVSSGERAQNARQAVARFTGQQTQAQGAAAGAAASADDGNLTGEFNIVSDVRTNSLIIVASEADYRKILTLLKKLDIAPRQVLIEILYAEINLDVQNQFGVNWTLLSQGSITLGGTTYGFDGIARQAVNTGADGFVYNLFEASRFRATLQALSSDTQLKVLSNPHIVASNNLEANIEIGDQVPIVTSRLTDNNNTNVNNFTQNIEYRDTGIILKITPSINENRFVTLEIDQEISEISERQTTGDVNPTFQNRSVQTTVLVEDGMSLVLGGLIRTIDTDSIAGIPGLIKIPWFGRLFGNSSRRTRSVELMTVITPHVIITSQDATLASDSLWERSKNVTEFFEDNKERFY